MPYAGYFHNERCTIGAKPRCGESLRFIQPCIGKGFDIALLARQKVMERIQSELASRSRFTFEGACGEIKVESDQANSERHLVAAAHSQCGRSISIDADDRLAEDTSVQQLR
jgi:hypothetical protein